ncbi:hypothetical protein [Pseudazoarcus pumilus]|uniref:Lipoprotein n=1 Tax=Pseudazoarcus pumilus TaxID=2067960 RepID=A0A2I6S9R7_9RHOO|nr:hypothetical protein [Pseudazoarcus pumilus]AUN96010.1 hypothetical protein C0099_14320 [Pseudazoarcus pumilus]
MMSTAPLRHVAGALLAVFVLAGCVAYGVEEPRHVRSFEIPKGHMPPPGACRIWFPDRPPGQQPPPGDCFELRQRVPPGAALVRG